MVKYMARDPNGVSDALKKYIYARTNMRTPSITDAMMIPVVVEGTALVSTGCAAMEAGEPGATGQAWLVGSADAIVCPVAAMSAPIELPIDEIPPLIELPI